MESIREIVCVYIYILYSNRWWNLSTKLVNLVTRRNNLTLDSTTMFVTARGFSFPSHPGISYTSFYKHGILERVSRFAVNWDSSIFLRLLFSPSQFLFSRLPENSTLDHGYSTVASFLSTAHSAKSRLERRVMLVILRIDRFSSHDRVEFAIRNVPSFFVLSLFRLFFFSLAHSWRTGLRNRLCGEEKLHYSDEFVLEKTFRYYFRKFDERIFRIRR